MVNFDLLSAEEKEAGELYVFMQKVIDGFKSNSQLLGLEEASIIVLSGMSDKDKADLIKIAKKHFVPSVCHEHQKDIVNDENYFEDIEEGEPSEGPVIDYDLNEPNLGRFFILEGAEGLRAHIKEMVGEGNWKELEDIEMKRIFDDDRWHRGGSAG